MTVCVLAVQVHGLPSCCCDTGLESPRELKNKNVTCELFWCNLFSSTKKKDPFTANALWHLSNWRTLCSVLVLAVIIISNPIAFSTFRSCSAHQTLHPSNVLFGLVPRQQQQQQHQITTDKSQQQCVSSLSFTLFPFLPLSPLHLKRTAWSNCRSLEFHRHRSILDQSIFGLARFFGLS
jgi:hypothetical protein